MKYCECCQLEEDENDSKMGFLDRMRCLRKWMVRVFPLSSLKGMSWWNLCSPRMNDWMVSYWTETTRLRSRNPLHPDKSPMGHGWRYSHRSWQFNQIFSYLLLTYSLLGLTLIFLLGLTCFHYLFIRLLIANLFLLDLTQFFYLFICVLIANLSWTCWTYISACTYRLIY
jgi:hypothetical protein